MKFLLEVITNYFHFIGFALVYFLTSFTSSQQQAEYFALWSFLILSIGKFTYSFIAKQQITNNIIFNRLVVLIFTFIALTTVNFIWLSIGLALTNFLSNLAVSLLFAKHPLQALSIMAAYNIRGFTNSEMILYIKKSFQRNYLLFIILLLLYAVASTYNSTYFIIGLIFVHPIVVFIINTRYYNGYFALAEQLKILQLPQH